MIGQITKGSDFGRLCSYLLRSDKNAEILDNTAFSDDPSKIAATFARTCARNPLVMRTVTHISLGFAEEDGELDRQTKTRVCEKVVERLGFGNCHRLVVAHGRSDEGHTKGHNHDHVHIALTSVDLEGKWVRDSHNFYMMQKVLRGIEKEEGLRELQSSWEKGRKTPIHGQRQRFDRENAKGLNPALPVAERLQTHIDNAGGASETAGEFAQKLADHGIETRFKITENGVIQGVSYEMQGVAFQGSKLHDASWPKLQGKRGLKITSDEISKIRQGHKWNRTQSLITDDIDQSQKDEASRVEGQKGLNKIVQKITKSKRKGGDDLER
jgi:hypothetical protein